MEDICRFFKVYGTLIAILIAYLVIKLYQYYYSALSQDIADWLNDNELEKNIFIGVLVALGLELFRIILLIWKYHRIAGEYSSFVVMEGGEHKIPENTPNLDIVGEIKITYEGGNKLKLVYNEIQNCKQWEGCIFMENQSLGKVVWKYTKPEHHYVIQGVKELIFFQEGQDKTILLIGKDNKGDFQELARRVKKQK
jgi:hypothetical protein